jgi:hypothetical protein
MTMLRERASKVAVALVALVAAGWSVSAPALASAATGGRTDRHAVSFLARVDGAVIRDPRPGLRELIQRGSQDGRPASVVADLAVAFLVSAVWRGRRAALLAARRRIRGLAAGRACRAPPAPQRA